MKRIQKRIFFFISVALLFFSSCSDSSEPSNSNSQVPSPPVTQNANVTPLQTPTPKPSATSSPAQSPTPVGSTPSPATNPSPTPQSNVKLGKAKGVVTKIDLDLGSIELDHEDIPGIMPPMIMEFYVKDKILLNGLKVGDKVSFTLEKRGSQETIIELKKQ